MSPPPSARGRITSITSSELLYSNIECDSVQPCTFDVHATSVSPSQKPTVSPYHCGTCCTCSRPISTLRRKLSATPPTSCTWLGVTTTSISRTENSAHQRIKPSG